MVTRAVIVFAFIPGVGSNTFLVVHKPVATAVVLQILFAVSTSYSVNLKSPGAVHLANWWAVVTVTAALAPPEVPKVTDVPVNSPSERFHSVSPHALFANAVVVVVGAGVQVPIFPPE